MLGVTKEKGIKGVSCWGQPFSKGGLEHLQQNRWGGQRRGKGLGARAKYCTNGKKGFRSNEKALLGAGEMELELGERMQQAQSSQCCGAGRTLPVVPQTLHSWPKA